MALSNNAIDEIVATPELFLYFRGRGSNKWHSTNASFLSKETLYKLTLKDNPNI